MGHDGLIYKTNSQKLYSGEIIDTVNVIIQYDVVKGKKNGLFMTHYLDGHLEKFGFIENNLNVGEWKYYFPNGNLESIGRFENSKAEGKWISYYSNGAIKTEGNYLNSTREGRWILYNNAGEIVNIIIYHDGEVIKVQNRIS